MTVERICDWSISGTTCCRRVCRHVEVNALPAFVVQNDGDYEKPERGVGRTKKSIDARASEWLSRTVRHALTMPLPGS